jgi:glutaryl-CoA dehydrogenase
MRTHAKRDGSDWILNGSKMWITNGSIADIAIVWATTKDGVCGFLIEKDTPGFTATDIRHKMSLRASITSSLFLDNVRVPDENRLPGVTGLKGPLSCLTQARYGIAWGAVGAALSCYEEALDYAKGRVQFGGKPIASHQLVQEKLVFMLTEITKAQLLVLQLGRLKDEGKATNAQVSLAKRNNVHQALEISRLARQILGANGILDDYAAMRHLCNLETVITYEGTHDIHTLILGNEITGIPAFE